MNLADIVGPGAYIMTYKIELERELETVGKLLERGSRHLDKMQKSLGSGSFTETLFKRLDAAIAKEMRSDRLAKRNTQPAELGKRIGETIGAQLLTELTAELHLDEITRHMHRAHDALPAFESFIHNKPTIAKSPAGPMQDYGTGFMLATKGGGDGGETLTELLMAQPQPIDPTDNVTDAMLRHRFEGPQQP